MKRTLIFLAVNVVMIVVTALVAVSCNPDVFIKPLDVSKSEFDVPFYGGSVEVQVSHGDWELERVAYNHIDIGFIEDGDGVMWYENNFIRLHLSRPQPSRLLLTIDDSVNTDPSLVEIFISNGYESEVISIKVGACSGYSFDRVEYGEPVVVSPEDAYELVWSKTVNNSSAMPMNWESQVFDDRFCRTLWFPASTVMSGDMPYVMWYETLMKFVGEPFDVPVPDSFLSGGALSFSDGNVEFSYDKIVQPVVFSQSNASVSLAPGSNTVKMYWGYVEYEVPYTMWFTHSGEGRDLYFCGKFTSKAFNGKWRVEL